MAKTNLKKPKFGTRGLLLLAILMVFLPSVFAVSLRLVKNTDYCLDCETIYEICKDSSMSVSDAAFSVNFYKPGAIKDSAFKNNLYLGTPYSYLEQHNDYALRTVNVTEGNGSVRSYEEWYITKQTNYTRYATSWNTLTLSSAATMFKNAAIGTCWNISIRGSLPPNAAIDNIITIGSQSWPAYAWWNSTFLYQRTATLNSTSAETLTDFPAPIVINTAALISAGKLQNDCDDIRLVNSTNGTMDYEVEACNTAQTVIWVRVPTYTANVTTAVTIYYGAPLAANAESPLNVWRNNFVSVYHGDGLTDSRGLNDVTAAGGASWTTNSSCKFGSCFYFMNNTGNFIKESPTGFPADTSLFPTLTGWGATATNGTTAVVLMAQGDNTGGKQRSMYFHLDAGEIWGDVYGTAHNPDMKVINLATMGYYAIAYKNSSCAHNIYQNLVNQTEWVAGCSVQNDHLRIGSNLENTNKWGSNGAPAYIDEVRFSNTTRSTGWLNAEYGSTATLGAETLDNSITFDTIVPSNLTSFNFINKRVNITYNYSGMNGTFNLYTKTNSSNQYWYYINGTSYSTTSNISHACSNTSTAALCQLDDNEILPGSYNVDPQQQEDNANTALATLTTPNDYYKVGLNNVTCDIYGILEVMINGTAGTPVPVIYCNSSYTSGNPTVNANCVQIATINASAPYNHTHGTNQYSKHRVIPFAVASAGCKINGIAVTPKSYFLFSGGSSNPVIWGTLNNSNPANMETSGNNGATWTTNPGTTANLHIHQLGNPTIFYYQLCSGLAADNSLFCSSVGTDIIELDYINPTTPFIYDVPTIIKQNSTIAVNWTPANDPNDLGISYNLTLFENGTLLDKGNYYTAGLQYNFSAAKPIGYYLLGVRANDSAGLRSDFDYTNEFYICANNYTCTSFGACLIYNVTECLAVTDLGCNEAFSGNLSSYNAACVYYVVSPPTDLTTIDLSQQGNIILFGVFLFFWVALGALAFTFKNFLYGGMMFFVGVMLGFWSFSISWILSAMFLLFSALFMFKTASFK